MQSSSFKPTIWDNTGSVVILSSKQMCNICHWIRKTTEHEAEVEITFSFVCSPIWPVDVCTGSCGFTQSEMCSLCFVLDSLAHQKLKVWKVHLSHQSNGTALRMAAQIPKGRRRKAGWNEKWNGADEFLSAPGLLRLTQCSDRPEQDEKNHFLIQGH